MGEGFGSVPSNAWWSSTTKAVNVNSAWLVDAWGYVDAWPKSQPWRVWPVRGESTGPSRLWRTGQSQSYAPGDDGALQKGVPWPMPRFTDLGECLLDGLTGLIWAKSTEGPSETWSRPSVRPVAFSFAGATTGACPTARRCGVWSTTGRLPSRLARRGRIPRPAQGRLLVLHHRRP